MGEAAAKEPTMEDILSSIRKIIAEEGEPEANEAGPEAALDSPVPAMEKVESAQPEEPREDKQPNLQEIVEKVSASSQSEPEMGAKVEPATPVAVAPVSSTPAEPAPKKAPSLADIAASVKAQEAAQAPKETVTPPVKAVEPEPSAPVEAAKPEASAPVEAPKPKPVVLETKVEMADAEPAPAKPQAEASQPVEAAKPEQDNDGGVEESAFKGALMSPSSNNLVSDSFERLKRSVMDDLDAKTEAILRPMLREWLDENLPTMVERMVREEIERVARG